jgi:hypothetical protein
MSNSALKLLAASGATDSATYVDDVFSTFLYKATGAPETFTNGIDLAGEGGLVWTKSRTMGTAGHRLVDTENGVGKYLVSDTSAALRTDSRAQEGITQFNSNGYAIGDHVNEDGFGRTNEGYVSWTFRKAPGFFDIVTYTGNGTAGRTVSHNLGSVPGMIIVKSLTNSFDWQVYHRSTGNTHGGTLNEAYAFADSATYWNDTSPTSAQFTVGNGNGVNYNNEPYVAYLFAHDAQVFGADEDESIIKCGSYTGNGNADGPTIDLGFEPQWLLLKSADGSDTWQLVDVMRNWSSNPGGTAASQAVLSPQTSAAENNTSGTYKPTSTGFKITAVGGLHNDNGYQYIYMAIRRPHKPAEEFAATDLFKADIRTSSEGEGKYVSGFVTDMSISNNYDASTNSFLGTRLINEHLQTNDTVASGTSTDDYNWAYNDGVGIGETQAFWGSSKNVINFMWRRAPGYFDVVAYTGLSTNGGAIPHNLGVVPELVIIKARTTTYDWMVAVPTGTPDGRSQSVSLNLDSASRNERLFPSGGQLPDASNVYLANENRVNSSSHTYIMYLFATVAGISKVGSYTGTGNDLNVDCGFSAGARFILIKRTDSTGDWYLWDSVRGIVAGNDPYLLLNTTAAQVTNTDYIDPLASGFTVTSSAPAALNASGGIYIFYAIA